MNKFFRLINSRIFQASCGILAGYVTYKFLSIKNNKIYNFNDKYVFIKIQMKRKNNKDNKELEIYDEQCDIIQPNDKVHKFIGVNKDCIVSYQIELDDEVIRSGIINQNIDIRIHENKNFMNDSDEYAFIVVDK